MHYIYTHIHIYIHIYIHVYIYIIHIYIIHTYIPLWASNADSGESMHTSNNILSNKPEGGRKGREEGREEEGRMGQEGT
jgi:hypothetical protein